MTHSVDVNWLSQQITDASVKGIMLAASTLIRDGQIAVGMQMPAVRELAELLGTKSGYRVGRMGAAEKTESTGTRECVGVWQ